MAQQFSGAPYLNSYGVQDRYGYNGEVSPDVAIEEQALNRKQQIANLLLQQGLQGAGSGQMVGRFFVPTSGAQHAAKIGEILAGAIGSHAIDGKRQDISANMNEERARAVQRYIDQTQGKQVPERTLPQGTPDKVVPVQGPPNITQPADPATGEFGAIQEQPAQITIPGTPPTQGPVNEAQFQAPDPMASRKAVMEAMSHQDPRVREAVRFMEQAKAQEEEKQAARAFQAQQADENRAVRREGIEANALTRVEQMKNTMALTQMQIAATERQGQDATAMKKQLADQAADLKKLEIQTKRETAQQHDETLKAIASGHDAAKQQQIATKPMPTAAINKQNEDLDLIGSLSAVNADLAALKDQVDKGKLKLGPVENIMSRGKNAMGMSDDNSKNFASFKSTLEKQRNASLMLHKGVQTEGDAIRAWNELFENLNDPGVVSQRLQEIGEQNERAVNIRKLNVDTLRENFKQEPFDFSKYEKQPAAVGKGGASGKTIKRTGTHNGKKVIEYSDGTVEYAP